MGQARHGILLVDKPAGVTSAAVVRRMKRFLGGAKVGHLGTLDPFATGLLPLCLGEGAKIVPFLNEERKAYSGRIRLGRETDTLDSTGETVEEAPVPALLPEQVTAAAAELSGPIEQVPPMFSAIKQQGVPLYRLARRGLEVERAPRKVEVFELELVPVGTDAIDFVTICSKGTYIRVLAADLGRRLGTRAHLESLRRTRFGRFRVEAAADPSDIERGDAFPLVSPREALADLPEVDGGPRVERELRAGRQAVLGEIGRAPREGEILKVLADNRLVALIGAREGRWRILRILNLD